MNIPSDRQSPPRNRSEFNRKVYEIVGTIPRGHVMTYGDIAALIPPPTWIDLDAYMSLRARWVGYAMADCPDGLPWHRVVNASGGISFRIGHGPHVQRQLLETEGLTFDAKGRIDLERSRWLPPSEDS